VGEAEITVKSTLDEDLMIAFNEANGHIPTQLVVNQIQTNRNLSRLIDLLEAERQPEEKEEEPQ